MFFLKKEGMWAKFSSSPILGRCSITKIDVNAITGKETETLSIPEAKKKYAKMRQEGWLPKSPREFQAVLKNTFNLK